MTLVSYTQNQEDVVLQIALSDVTAGFYIDVGGFHPIVDSVTNVFYEMGWSGINIEPISEQYKLFVEQRDRDINIETAVGSKPGKATLYVSPRLRPSTLLLSYAEREHFETNTVEVLLVSLNQICEEHRPAGDIHFLKIDVEGFEKEVLLGFDLTKYRPWIILVEALDPVTYENNTGDWEDLILNSDYQLVYFDGLNNFYLANERNSLKSRIGRIPVLLEGFTTPRNLAAESRLSELDNIQSGNTTLVRELQFVRGEEQALIDELEVVRGANNSLNGQLQTAISERDLIVSELEFLRHQHHVTLERLDGILESKTWRFTATPRRAFFVLRKLASFVRNRRLLILSINHHLKRWPRFRMKIIRFALNFGFVENSLRRALLEDSPSAGSKPSRSDDSNERNLVQALARLI